MPRVGSEQYVLAEEPTATTSTGTGDVKTVAPSSLRAIGAWITIEGVAARVTFGGTTPGVTVAPGVVVPAGTPPLFYPFPFTPSTQPGPKIKFASNASGSSIMSVIFVL